MMKLYLTVLAFLYLITVSGTENLQQEISGAIAEGKKQIVLKNKEYRIAEELRLNNLDGVVIDGNGARVIRTTLSGGIAVNNCRKLTLKNFTLDYDPLPFTQGVITRIDGHKLYFRIDQGYPRLSPVYAVRQINFFEADGMHWKKMKGGDIYGPTFILNGNEGYCEFHRIPPELVPGDRIVLNYRGSYGIRMDKSEKITLENLRIHSAPGVAILSRFCKGGDIFRRVIIERGPTPQGATTPRLISTSADGLNCAFLRKGPLVEWCDFSYMADDSVNLHSVALPVVRKISGNTFDTIRQFGREAFPETLRPGDSIRILSAGQYKVKGTARVVSFRVSPRKYGIEEANRFYGRNWNRKKFTAYELVLDREPPLAEGDFFDLPELAGSRYTIRNNYFHDHRARGLRLMASHGLIENNRIERTKASAIAIGCEYGYWREAGWVENVVVRSNRLYSIGKEGMTRDDCYCPGAISVFAKLEDYSGHYRGNRDICIENNVIQNVEGAGIFAFRVDGLCLHGNQVRNAFQNPLPGGKNFPFGTASPVWIVDSVLRRKQPAVKPFAGDTSLNGREPESIRSKVSVE